ncbi:PD40 domain-containing protein [candidate division KSB1 bacterium]|nr:PD40 domain-containing protein [candidate division KSB1 bacterium]
MQSSRFGHWISFPLWGKSGRYIYFISNADGYKDLWRVELSDDPYRLQGSPKKITQGFIIEDPDLSPDDDKIIFTKFDRKHTIFSLPLKTELVVEEYQEVMANLPHLDGFRISPNGQSMVVETAVQGRQALVIKSVSDGAQKVLYDAQPAYGACWSPDGKWIAFDAGGGDAADIWRISSDGGAAEKIVEHPGSDWMPTYSPTGDSLCFLSNRSGQFDLWIQNLRDGSAHRMTDTPESESAGFWSHSGRMLAYFREIKLATLRLCLYDLRQRREIEMRGLYRKSRATCLSRIVWKYDDSALYFIAIVPEGVGLMELSLADMKVRTIKSFKYWEVSDHFDLHGDTIFIAQSCENQDIWMVEGLTALE